MSDELKPCPFCGGQAYLRSRHDHWRIECTDCPVQIAMDTAGCCVEAWHRRRTPGPATARLLAAAKDTLALLVDLDEDGELGRSQKIRIERFGAAVAEHEAATVAPPHPPGPGHGDHRPG